MNIDKFYDDTLAFFKEELDKLDYDKAMLMGYLCSTRMVPSYVLLCEREKFGNPSLAKSILLFIFNLIDNNEIIDDRIRDKVNEFNKFHIPDTEDFGSILGTCALEGANSLIYLYYFHVSKEDQDFMFQIYDNAFECIYMAYSDSDEDCLKRLEYEKDLFTKQIQLLYSIEKIDKNVVDQCINLQNNNIVEKQVLLK